jgi:hypothetical protein
MAKTRPSDEIAEELQTVIDFRLARLIDGGYEIKNAEKLASNLEVDWHLAVRVKAQCPDEKLIMRMLT